MINRPACWRMPTPRQMESIAREVGRKAPATPGPAPSDDLPLEYWQALLDDPCADGANPVARASGRTLRLSRIPEHILRVGCRRCARIVEIQKADAIRLYGPDAIWWEVGQRLLDDTCTQRTGRHEEDGCWPKFE